jgi:transposase
MLPSLNYSKKDPKFVLLGSVFKCIDNKNAMRIYSRNGVKNISFMVICIKIILMGGYFNYPVYKVVEELNRVNQLKKFMGIDGEVPNESQIYEFMSRYSADQFVKIVNNLLKMCNKSHKTPYKTYIIDGTAVECDINHVSKYITPEKLEKLELKWGYSSNKKKFHWI